VIAGKAVDPPFLLDPNELFGFAPISPLLSLSRADAIYTVQLIQDARHSHTSLLPLPGGNRDFAYKDRQRGSSSRVHSGLGGPVDIKNFRIKTATFQSYVGTPSSRSKRPKTLGKAKVVGKRELPTDVERFRSKRRDEMGGAKLPF